MTKKSELGARLADLSARIGVIGLGYVGRPLTVTAAMRGHGYNAVARKGTPNSHGRSPT